MHISTELIRGLDGETIQVGVQDAVLSWTKGEIDHSGRGGG